MKPIHLLPTSARARAAKSAAAPTRSAKLRDMLQSAELEFLMEAHNGLSARIVKEAGFQGIWASGLSISAQFGVRDNNEASWTQVVDVLEFMADASDLPILLDGDTGYGNFNNMRRLVRKLEQRGIAGVCIEDKQFPKTNSFLNGERQPLADIEEFVGKIAAGKDTQSDATFCIVARVEALIAGWGMEEALRRAEAYRLAGADAILIHSKLSKPDEILTFAREWAHRSPLVIVPTRYYSTPTEVFRKAGISTVIWANHLVRSAAAAMQSVAREIFESQTLVNVEDRIAPVNEIFRLQDADEYTAAERLYLSASSTARAAVVLAASRGRGLDAITTDRPKVMLPIAGKPLLRWLIDSFKKERIDDITVVGGYRADAIDTAGIKLKMNERFADTGELASLACAVDDLDADTIISYGDLLFRSYVLRDLVDTDADFAVVVDSSPPDECNRTVRDFAYCSRGDDRGLFGSRVLLQRIAGAAQAAEAVAEHQGSSAEAAEPSAEATEPSAEATEPSAESNARPAAQGRWIGMLKVSRRGVAQLKAVMRELRGRSGFDALDLPQLLNALIAAGAAIEVLYVHGHWRGVNDLEDLRSAVDFAHGQPPPGGVPGESPPAGPTRD
jgi:phosphoenolpyruvate phosphomutase